MRKLILLTALALPLAAQDTFDFAVLDKLGTNSTSRSNITLDGDMLKLASSVLGSSKDAGDVKALVDSLHGIYIRSWEFDKEGQYNEADLGPLRDYLKQHRWSKIVDVHEKKEVSEIWTLPQDNSRIGGIAILSAEPKEATVVYINGSLKAEDIAKLSGTMGIPDLKSMQAVKKAPKQEPKKETDKTRKDDEEN
jgi:hypothetical protein